MKSFTPTLRRYGHAALKHSNGRRSGLKAYCFIVNQCPRVLRGARGERARGSALDAADIVFLDPDNGVSHKETVKHATFSEIRLLRKPGRAVIFITFPGRVTHDVQLRQLHERLRVEADASKLITLRTSVSVPRSAGPPVPRLRWFTVVDPDAELMARAHAFAEALGSVPRVRAHLHATT